MISVEDFKKLHDQLTPEEKQFFIDKDVIMRSEADVEAVVSIMKTMLIMRFLKEL